MKAKVIQIGNSRGVRLPKSVLEEMGQPEEVYLEASRGSVIIRPVSAPRAQWAEAFQQMAEQGDDALILGGDGASSEWDRSGWKWK